MLLTTRRAATALAAAAVLPVGLLTGSVATAAAAPARAGAGDHRPAAAYQVRQILNGARLSHTFVSAGPATARSEPLAQPDDITRIGGDLFTGFQNGVGPQDRPARTATSTARWSSSPRPAGCWLSRMSRASAMA